MKDLRFTLLLLIGINLPSWLAGQSFEGLGFSESNQFQVTVTDVSDDGSVIVGTGAGFIPYRWENGTVQTIPMPEGEGMPLYALGATVSGDGKVMVVHLGPDGFRWENGVYTSLTPLDGGGWAISSDGSVVVGQTRVDELNTPASVRMFRLAGKELEILLPPANYSTIPEPRAISGDGSIFVGRVTVEENGSKSTRVFRWEDGVLELLPLVSTGAYIIDHVRGISDDGRVIVGWTAIGDSSPAIAWVDKEPVVLGVLPGGFIAPANAVSADGSVIVGYSQVLDSNVKTAFIWTAEDGMKSLAQFLTVDQGLDLAGWTLATATAISASGNFIVGQGINPSGLFEGWRVELPVISFSIIVPEGEFSIDEPFVAEVRVASNLETPQTITFTNGLLSVEDESFLDLQFDPVDPFELTKENPERSFEAVVIPKKLGGTKLQSTISIAGSVDLVTTEKEITIKSKGDLLIKRGAQKPEFFGEDDVYQETPLGQQRELISVAEGQTATFDIMVQNDNEVPATFFLQAEEDPDDQWETAYTLNGVDIKTAVLSQGGYSTGELEPGASILVKAVYTPVSAEIGGEKNVLFRLFDQGGVDVDTLEATAKRVELVVLASMHELELEAIDRDSLKAGKSDSKAPLIPVTDSAILARQEEILYGLVGDGVTPLLFKFEADPTVLGNLEEDFVVKLDLRIEAGGLLGNESIEDRFLVLIDGQWVSGDELTFDSENSKRFAYLTPIEADEVRISEKPGELTVLLEVTGKDSAEVIEEMSFYIRKPPIILIHGYNTDGNWGADFMNTLHSLRPRNKVSFVRTGYYGQKIGRSGLIKDELNYLNTAYINTIFPLKNLVPLASSQAFDREFAAYKGFWAVTKHDVIAHSQGGVLTRMLCADQPNQHLARAYRSESDFFRGRFHRIVTIGSPQNGSRILYYMRALLKFENFASLLGSIPVGVSELMGVLDVSQSKFDPFDHEIREINDPATIWAVDDEAQFHIVRTTVSDGKAPAFPSSNPSDYGLGLAHELGGLLVLPRGSDGVVDWDSMGCHAPGATASTNVFTITGTNIAHASAELFGGDSSQTASTVVAEHVLSALGQGLLPSKEIFGVFPMPPLLSDKVREDIDLWASNVSYNFLATLRILNKQPGERTPGPPVAAAEPAVINLSLGLSPENPIFGQVNWIVEFYDETGISYGELSAVPDATDPLAATLEIPEDLVGQVVVYANYVTESGGFVFAPPLMVADQAPSGSAIAKVSVLPDNQLLPTGTGTLVQVWVEYDDGRSHRVFITSDTFSAQSSDPSIIDTSESTAWRMLTPGTATVSGDYAGFDYSVDLSVYSVTEEVVSLDLATGSDGVVSIIWPGVLTGWDLEKSYDLENWEVISEGIEEDAGLLKIYRAPDEPSVFYRLRSEE